MYVIYYKNKLNVLTITTYKGFKNDIEPRKKPKPQ